MFQKLPKSIVILATIIGGMEFLFSMSESAPVFGLTGEDLRLVAMRDFGFWDQIFTAQISTFNIVNKESMRLFTYSFIHVNFVASMFSVVFTLAFGNLLARYANDLQIITFYLMSTFFGALAYGLLLDDSFPLLGSSPGFFGFVGGFIFLLALQYLDGKKDFEGFFAVPVFLLSAQIGFQLVFGGPNYWIADLIGFITGFLLFPLLQFGFINTLEIFKRLVIKILSRN
ncbi:MAG: rhomboid family intramembrane serine protease [Rhodobacteraceae bacterium]|nr:rhomboid family intramembrane serine protease [Paracoccaceae bacterium]